MDIPASLLLISFLTCVFSSIILFCELLLAYYRQNNAYKGDSYSAKYIVLPCYRPLFRGLILFFSSFSIVFFILLLVYQTNSPFYVYPIVSFFNLILLIVFSISPILLCHKSVSRKAFYSSANTLLGYFSILFVFWLFLVIFYNDHYKSFRLVFGIIFIIFILIPFFLAIGILAHKIYSRVQIGSLSNRNSTELMGLYSLFYGLITALEFRSNNSIIERSDELNLTISLITLGLAIWHPFALYRTLLADTKFWRGLGRFNKEGIQQNQVLRESGYVEKNNPTLNLNVVSSDNFQYILSNVNDIIIDFAYLKLDYLIGQGATAKVFASRFKKNKRVAIKLYTPPEVTEEVMDTFIQEALRSSRIKAHANIVSFIGICVRPPQIGMVFEFCSGGNLKYNLEKDKVFWTMKQRLMGCLDCIKGVKVFHSCGLIHRDIKTENFFVNDKLKVKLGDFGESTIVRSKESTVEKRMTILGTVAYMAPELIYGERYYNQAIDIYAIGVTFWEILSGGLDPYGDLPTFEIYEKIKNNETLKLSDEIIKEISQVPIFTKSNSESTPTQYINAQAIVELIASLCHLNPMNRPTADEALIKLIEILTGGNFSQDQNTNSISSRESFFLTSPFSSPIRNSLLFSKSNNENSGPLGDDFDFSDYNIGDDDTNSEKSEGVFNSLISRASMIINPILNLQASISGVSEEESDDTKSNTNISTNSVNSNRSSVSNLQFDEDISTDLNKIDREISTPNNPIVSTGSTLDDIV